MNINELSPWEQKLFRDFMGHPWPHSIKELTLYHMLPAYIFMEIYQKTCGIELESAHFGFGDNCLIFKFNDTSIIKGWVILKKNKNAAVVYSKVEIYSGGKNPIKTNRASGDYCIEAGYQCPDQDGKFAQSISEVKDKSAFPIMYRYRKSAEERIHNSDFFDEELFIAKEIIDPIIKPYISIFLKEKKFKWVDNLLELNNVEKETAE